MMRIVQGDITKLSVDAIVNAANQVMLGGGGVDGAIHRVAGKELFEACLKVPEVHPGVRCPTGEARITPGFRLPAKFVIHKFSMRVDGEDWQACRYRRERNMHLHWRSQAAI